MSDLTKLLDCKDDVTSHLSTYHLSKTRLSEYELILARTGLFDWKYEDVSNWWICPRHRHTFGKFWLPRKRSCNSPVHTGAMKVLTGRDVVTYEMSKWMQKLYGCTVQVGTGEKRCLVKDGVEMSSAETETLIFNSTGRGYSYLGYTSGWLIHLEGCYKGLP